MRQARDAVRRTQHALSEDEIRALVQRCPDEHRWAFTGWLRGERLLDGDLVQEPAPMIDPPQATAPAS